MSDVWERMRKKVIETYLKVFFLTYLDDRLPGGGFAPGTAD
jgi:hypothetical protein